MVKPATVCLIVTGLLTLVGTGCRAVYNSTLENVFGYEKRELLRKSVTSLRQDQQQAQEEFKDAMTRLKELYGFEGGELERVYGELKNSFEACEAQAKDVRKRIENMEGIADSMFDEWEEEIEQYSSPELAGTSRRQLQQTRERYDQLSRLVHDSEASMGPVLAQIKDQVLFLKHNLNAAAIGSLRGEATHIQDEIQDLITRMNASIAEADRFIETLGQ